MTTLPHPHLPQRPARVRPAEYTPAVLRIEDGSCTEATLELFSLTGGLLSIAQPLDRGSRARLMFLTQTGPVLGMAEMLPPVSWKEQPFRFVTLHVDDRRRLRAATGAPEDAMLANEEPAQVDGASAPVKITPTLESEEHWIAKYREALDLPEPQPRYLTKILLALLGAATLGFGFLYALQIHLIR